MNVPFLTLQQRVPLSCHTLSLDTIHPGQLEYQLNSNVAACCAADACTGVQEVARQVRAVQKARLHGVQLVEFDVDDPMKVNIALMGASDTPFQGRQLFMSLKFPNSYPERPPVITFQHPLYHPNIYTHSNALCWSDDDNTGSTYNLEGIIGMVNTLMAKPNPASPANREAAQLYMRDESVWRDTARAKAKDVLFTL